MSQVYQARFPNMTCNQCAGPIAMGQDIQRDGRKVRQDGTEGGNAWKHANPSDCIGARSNPRQYRTSNKHGGYRVIFSAPRGKEIHHTVHLGDGDRFALSDLRFLAAKYIANESGMTFEEAHASIRPKRGNPFRDAGGAYEAQELLVNYVAFPRRSTGMDGRRASLTFTLHTDPRSAQYKKQIAIIGAAEAAQYRLFPDFGTAFGKIDSVHKEPYTKSRGRSNPRRRKAARRNPGKDMHEQDLRKKNFRGADLWGAQLWRSNLSGVNLSNATLAQAAIWEADLSGANLSGAQLGEANLAGSNLTGANLRGAKMVDTNIDGADFTEADLRGTDMADVMFAENARFMDALYDDKTEWPWSIEDPEMQVGARHERTMVLNPRRRKKTARRRKNPTTSAKLEALAKEYGTRSKAGKLAMSIAKDLKRQGH